MAEDRSPIDAALDVMLYAPLGLVITATEQLPELAEKGRARLSSQVTAARIVGRFAVNQGRRELARRRRQASYGSAENGGATAPHATTPPPDEPSPCEEVGASESPPEPARSPGRGAGEGASKLAAPSEDLHLAIPGYDSLSASQVVSRLAGLTSEELAEVAEYEASHRGRRTVMNRVRQLQV